MSALTRQFERRPKAFSAAASVLLVAVIGLIDYLAGYAIFFSAFYLLPVALASWYVGKAFGAVISISSVAVSLVGDYAAGAAYPNVLVPIWNGLISLTIYFVVVKILTSLRKLHGELEARVRQRTTALTSEMLERARLEKEILEVSEREQRRIGHDLHDGICQHWAATAIAGQVLGEKLAAKSLPEAADAREVVRLVENGITLTRNLAHGIAPPEMEADGLMLALEEFAATSSALFKVSCRFDCDSPVLIHDLAAAGHLYRIAQEAVGNAIKHGKARNILIRLDASEENTELCIKDDGSGLPDPLPKERGMGLRIMAHRAAMIGGQFTARRDEPGGTLVTCTLSAHPNSEKSDHE